MGTEATHRRHCPRRMPSPLPYTVQELNIQSLCTMFKHCVHICMSPRAWLSDHGMQQAMQNPWFMGCALTALSMCLRVHRIASTTLAAELIAPAVCWAPLCLRMNHSTPTTHHLLGSCTNHKILFLGGWVPHMGPTPNFSGYVWRRCATWLMGYGYPPDTEGRVTYHTTCWARAQTIKFIRSHCHIRA